MVPGPEDPVHRGTQHKKAVCSGTSRLYSATEAQGARIIREWVRLERYKVGPCHRKPQIPH